MTSLKQKKGKSDDDNLSDKKREEREKAGQACKKA
jgi:hypothetical protein